MEAVDERMEDVMWLKVLDSASGNIQLKPWLKHLGGWNEQ